jgi:hypothetical protein
MKIFRDSITRVRIYIYYLNDVIEYFFISEFSFYNDEKPSGLLSEENIMKKQNVGNDVKLNISMFHRSFTVLCRVFNNLSNLIVHFGLYEILFKSL